MKILIRYLHLFINIKFFLAELMINIFTTILAFIYGSVLVFSISLVLNFYNMKKIFRNEHKLYFAIGEENKIECEKFSLTYKFKFIAYLSIVILCLAYLVIFFLIKFIEIFIKNGNFLKCISSLISYIWQICRFEYDYFVLFYVIYLFINLIFW